MIATHMRTLILEVYTRLKVELMEEVVAKRGLLATPLFLERAVKLNLMYLMTMTMVKILLYFPGEAQGTT